MCSPDCFLAIIACLFPPLPVWVKRGICSGDSVINIALCVLGFLPGLFHAWYIIGKYPDPFEDVVYRNTPLDRELRPHIYHPVPQRPSYHHQQPPMQGGLLCSQHQPEGYGSFSDASSSEPYPRNSPAEGSNREQGEPPSYASVVKGDNKVQHD